MGADAWHYFIPFQESVSEAVEQLKLEVFCSGEFRGSELNLETIEQALINMEADGTASILDIFEISRKPCFGCLSPMSSQELTLLFDSSKPRYDAVKDLFDKLRGSTQNDSKEDTKESVLKRLEIFREKQNKIMAIYERIERGEARYVALYDEIDNPSHYLIVGLSFD